MTATCWNPLALSVAGANSISSSSSSSSSSSCLFLKPPKRIGRFSGAVKVKQIRADYRDTNTGGGSGGGDFFAGFLVGGALCGTLSYIFAPQIRRSLLSEDEYGFTRGRKPMYYDNQDNGLERTRQTLSEKIGQLNSAIDKVSSRLRGVNKNRNNKVLLESGLEEEVTF